MKISSPESKNTKTGTTTHIVIATEDICKPVVSAIDLIKSTIDEEVYVHS
jgi:hypothetical protein